MAEMKVLASLLLLVVLVHCACIGRCWGEEAISLINATPPCHQHEGKDSPDGKSANLCSEGPALEAKTSLVVGAAWVVAPVLALPLTLTPHNDFSLLFDPVSPPLRYVSVLRI
jgi:hypothetical protein